MRKIRDVILLEAITDGLAGDPHSDRDIFHWACNACLDNGKALIGDLDKQKWCDCYPYFSYSDEKRHCQDCGREYIFHKEEQRHWYEVLGFWVQSRPKCCKECYKRRKELKSN